MVCGCSRNTTIRTQDGAIRDVYIEGSDKTSVQVIDERGRRVSIPRSQIREVDHPGDAAMVVGVGMVMLGALAVQEAQAYDCQRDQRYDCDEDPEPAAWRVFGVLAGIGLAVTIYGAAAWETSASRFEQR